LPGRQALNAPLAAFVARYPRLFVLTGAGCSTASGIPDYRDASGWKARPPMRYAEFTGSPAARRRYWARSLLGWPRVAQARPNAAHVALARLEAAGLVRNLVTQNVDGLHQKAGSRRVLDLHGRLDEVECLACGAVVSRHDVQELLAAWNPRHATLAATPAPDGDARLADDLEGFEVPDCPACGGVLKPRVVFFGEGVPRPRVDAALLALAASDAVLVVGSSLMVFSGYRFCLAAESLGLPVAALNLGRTRAEERLALKVSGDCGSVLAALADELAYVRSACGEQPHEAQQPASGRRPGDVALQDR
jgi:NAD-dependent SIR2 family protein deacetylase